jgi:hypothetical protein
MTEIVLGVGLVGGDHPDVACEETSARTDDIVERIISTLAQDGGPLRCKHGGRLIVLYGRVSLRSRWPRAARSCNGRRDPVTDPAAGGFGRIARRERGGSR